MQTRNLINEFLAVKRFAMVGVSRHREEFSRRLFDEFVKRGYEVVPVNPNAPVIEGKPCFARVKDITPPVTSALVTGPRSLQAGMLRDCAEGGVTLVWIFGISGDRSVSEEALAVCEKHGMQVVRGYCPFMFLPETAFFHRLHAGMARVFGQYPR
jgi:predicted CoA-binding protein